MATGVGAIPTPPPTPPPSSTPVSIQPSESLTVPIITSNATTSDLILHLDALLETYLHNLDIYTGLRASLSKEFANGFLCLAQANRNTTTGRRYGEESYDSRMKAGRRVYISRPIESTSSVEEEKRDSMTAVEATNGGLDAPTSEEEQETFDLETVVEKIEILSLYSPKLVRSTGTSSKPAQPQEKSSTTGNPTPTDTKDQTTTTTQPPDKELPLDAKSKTTPSPLSTKPIEKIKDPLLQFGVLVPLPLRASQNHFTKSVAETIPNLLDVIGRMRWLEDDIEKIRERLKEEKERGTAEERKGGVEESELS